ncbi:MAG: hypothetical protein JNK02_04405 [Planctomycetes bacterium]|nr:hypothetical protein [Planctomycetota bacterium]
MKDTFVATEPWNPTRPHVLVVCCSDGRFHQPITEFVRVVVSDRSDLLAVPGGPVILDPWASSFDETRVFDTAFDLFLQYHDLNQCWLIAHEGCAYYRMKQPGLTDREYEVLQYRDLRRGAQIVANRAPHLAIHLRFARLVAGRISFEEVLVEPAARSIMHS